MGCESGCGKTKGYTKLRAAINGAVQSGVCASVPSELILAVGIRESHGDMFFSDGGQQFKDNLAVWCQHSKLHKQEALAKVRILGGDDSGKIAKFRCEPSWKASIDAFIAKEPRAKGWEDILYLSIGYFQKGMIWHLSAKSFDEWVQAYDTFLRSSREQVRVCSFDLHGLIHRSRGDVPLALSRYNGGPSVKHVSEYGEQVYDLFRYLLKEQ
jgi:hypothetical protein